MDCLFGGVICCVFGIVHLRLIYCEPMRVLENLSFWLAGVGEPGLDHTQDVRTVSVGKRGTTPLAWGITRYARGSGFPSGFGRILKQISAVVE